MSGVLLSKVQGRSGNLLACHQHPVPFRPILLGRVPVFTRHASTTRPRPLWVRSLKNLSVFALGALVCYAFTHSERYSSTTRLQDVPPIFRNHGKPEKKTREVYEWLVALLGEDGVSDDVETRIAHSSTEWSPAPNGDYDRPSLVVYPKTTQEVSMIAKICCTWQVPIIAFSGGTSLEATLAAQNGEICIDFSRMNKVIELHKDDMDVIVQPGVGYDELNEQLAAHGLFFPPDPGPGAKIGGMVSQSCSGTNAYRYGTMKDWVLGLTVVLADGTIIKTRHRPRKSNAGYDLTRLFIGSEGTLGLITEASLRLTNKPENVQVAVAAFPSTHDAVSTATTLVQKGQPLAAIELLDNTTMRAVNHSGYTPQPYPEQATLFLKFSGSSTQVQEQIAAARASAQLSKCTSFTVSHTDEEATALWQARKTILWGMIALKRDPDDKFLSADAAVPISRLADIIEATKAKLDASGLIGFCVGHVGDGNFHASVLYGAEDREKAEGIIREVQRMGVDMGGTVTGEHGIGLIYRDALIYEVGQSTVDAMRRIKLALDPMCLLNPGKVFRLWPEDRDGLGQKKGTKEVGDSSQGRSSP